jgi:hypothetical protein
MLTVDQPTTPGAPPVGVKRLLATADRRIAAADDALRSAHGDGLELRGVSELPVIRPCEVVTDL